MRNKGRLRMASILPEVGTNGIARALAACGRLLGIVRVVLAGGLSIQTMGGRLAISIFTDLAHLGRREP